MNDHATDLPEPEPEPSTAATTPDFDPYFRAPPAPKQPRVWGPWATLGFSLLCIIVLLAAQAIGAIAYIAVVMAARPGTKVSDLVDSGNVLVVATLFSTIATVSYVALMIVLRRYPIRDYLDLSWPPPRTFFLWFGLLVALQVATDLTSVALGRPIVPQVMVNIYHSGWAPGIWFAFVILAPIGEETLFRGFLYTGIARSIAGPGVAIALGTIIFTLLHTQYDWYGMAGVGALGLFLGIVRWRARSLPLAIFFHGFSNLVGTLEIVLMETWFK
jgi:membrane protease YdiL (CAAX protease family)